MSDSGNDLPEGDSGGAVFQEKLHVGFIRALAEKTDSFEHVVMEHLKMSAVYWALTGMATMGRNLQEEMQLDDIVRWVLSCQHQNGGFAGNNDHDPHLLYTLSAVQILAIANQLHQIDRPKIAKYVAKLQQPDGSFVGDEWGEVDTRFSYCALSTLSILGYLPTSSGDTSHTEETESRSAEQLIDVPAAVKYVLRCRNFDGGFGCIPGAESHAGQVFVCVAALAIGNGLQDIDPALLGWWLCERQCDSGGLNGRPEKQADVCYSWWILSTLSILNKVHWINPEKLKIWHIIGHYDPESFDYLPSATL